jgi:formate dehydrogenase major subunit
VPGLGASFGRGAATSHLADLANSDCVLIMGSNMAEAHPVGFRFPMQAKEKGARLIHVDPRFSRTSAMCDVHVQIRAGTDIVFLGALIHQVLEREAYFKDYVLAYSNASTIIEEGYVDAESNDGIFSGYNGKTHLYKAGKGHWGYAGHGKVGGDDVPKDVETGKKPEPEHGGGQHKASGSHGVHGGGIMGGASTHEQKRGNLTDEPGGEPPRDETLQDPRCVLQILKRHYSRYTPEMAERACGCSRELVLRVADLLIENSGPDRTSAICYAVGWTQHTTGVQMIRAAGILQTLLGNIGRPGGGIMALRGHASIQGSTDIPTLYDLLPGYIPQPVAERNHETVDGYCEYEGLETGYWSNYKKFVVSLMKAWYGDAATAENDWAWRNVPRIDGDYSQLPYFDMMREGRVRGYFLFGQNPAGGGPNAGLHRAGLRELDWLVVLDWFPTESAMFWKDDPKGPPPSQIKTEVFFLPAAAAPEKEGSFTNTNRLLQWHDKALDPPGDCRSDAWYVYNLGKRLKNLYSGSTLDRDRPIRELTWDYEYEKRPVLPNGRPSRIHGEPDVEKVLQEINGYDLTRIDERSGRHVLLSGFSALEDDGTTACGCWIYSGVFPEPGRNRARSRKRTHTPAEPDWGFAWPHNRRIMYNRASARPDGQPWSERKKYLWWDAEKKKWTGHDEPDFEPDKAPDYRPDAKDRGMKAIGGAEPFIMKPDGRAWLFAPGGTKDGPLPTHYEPVESPLRNPLYGEQINPTTRLFPSDLNELAAEGDADFPIVACTFRLTEHYLSGPMSRFNSWLNELQPEMFVEVSPELAREKGLKNGDWCVVSSRRSEIQARVLVTHRIRPIRLDGRTIHQIGIPFHWGYAGESVGSVANDLTSLVADPNVSMHEGKVFTCNLRAGRLSISERPTVPYAPWPSREPVPDTPSWAQPEGHLK